MSINVTLLKPESVSEVIHFFNNEQSDKKQQNNRPSKEFEWLFFKGLYKPSIYLVARDSDNEDIIGTQAGIFFPMISPSGDPVMTLKGEDSLISLDRMIKFGKRDLLKELLDIMDDIAKTDNVKFIWGFTPAKAAFKRCSYKIVCTVKGSFYVINPIKFYRHRIDQYPQMSNPGKILLLGFSFHNFIRQTLLSIQFTQIKCRQISFDEINEKTLLSFLPIDVYATYLTKEFINWRITDNPAHIKYGIIEFANKTDEVISYLIFSYNEHCMYFIEQILFRSSISGNSKIRIMKLAFAIFKSQKAIAIRASGFSHNRINIEEMRLLKRTGFYFFNNPEGSNIIFKDLSGTDIKPEDVYLSRLNTQGLV